MNRKEFISFVLVQMLSPSLNPKAFAYESESNSPNALENYILLNMWDSPPRWLFDLPLAPKENHKLINSPMICNELTKSGPTYKRTSINGHLLSSFLNEEMASRNSKMHTKMSKCLENALIIRGCNMNKDGHEINNKALESSSFSSASIGGLISNRQNLPLAALSCNGLMPRGKGASSSFKHPKSRALLTTQSNNKKKIIDQLVDKISGANGWANYHDEDFISLLEKINNSKIKNLEQLKKLNHINFNQLFKFYDNSKNKYDQLLKDTIAINNQSLKNYTHLEVELPRKFKGTSENIEHYLGQYLVEDYILLNCDPSQMFQDSTINTISSHFALAQTCLEFKLTNTIYLNIDTLTNVDISKAQPKSNIQSTRIDKEVVFDLKNKYLKTNPKLKELEFNNDPHFIGTIPTLIGFKVQYRLMATCLNEFISYLKDKSLFDKSLIHLTSEFERAPQKLEAGSDHGWQGHTSTLISGKFKEMDIYGNIKVNSTNILGDLECTWGEASKMKSLDRQIRYGDIITTIAHLFDIKSPEGGVNLLTKKKNQYFFKWNECRNV